MTPINERPILFSGEMVRAIIQDRKTMTRRVSGLEDVNKDPDAWTFKKVGDLGWMAKKRYQGRFGAYFESDKIEPRTISICPQVCPYGRPGDRLWVRETWRCEELESGLDGVRFKADGSFRAIENTPDAADAWVLAFRPGMQGVKRVGQAAKEGKWRPSIYMPRWASRITLEILNVRVERLQCISKEDARAEGMSGAWLWSKARNARHPEHFVRGVLSPQVANFSVLWDELNGPRGFGWDANPWVWVIEFKRVED